MLLLFWVISRLLTSHYYIEDPDSLRFALASQNFNPQLAQPHFPLYPVFVFLSQITSSLLGSFALGFSFIGAVSGWLITLSSFFWLRWWSWEIDFNHEAFPWRLKHSLLAAFIFFNPMIWIMSNRFMPDLCGLAVVSLIFACLSQLRFQSTSLLFWVGLLVGLLFGVRLSYSPLLLPCIWLLRESRFYRGMSTGILVWLVPMLFLVNPLDIWDLAWQQVLGHFQDFGGSAFTESNLLERLTGFLIGFWGAGLNGYWWGRWPVMLIHGVPILAWTLSCLGQSLKRPGRWFESNSEGFRFSLGTLLILPSMSYFTWILFGQNIIFKFRHQMPLVLLFILLITMSFQQVNSSQVNWKRVLFWRWAAVGVSFVFTSIIIVSQSMEPVAMYQTKIAIQKNSHPQVIFAVSMVGHFMQRQGVQSKFIIIDDLVNPEYELEMLIEEHLKEGYLVRFIGGEIYSYPGTSRWSWSTQKFFHNPWVNPIWSQVHISTLDTQNKVGSHEK